MLDRRAFLAGMATLFAMPLAAEAQQRRIGVLTASGAPPSPGGMAESLWLLLRATSWVIAG